MLHAPVGDHSDVGHVATLEEVRSRLEEQRGGQPVGVQGVGASAQVAITTAVGRPVTASITWCSPSPQASSVGGACAEGSLAESHRLRSPWRDPRDARARSARPRRRAREGRRLHRRRGCRRPSPASNSLTRSTRYPLPAAPTSSSTGRAVSRNSPSHAIASAHCGTGTGLGGRGQPVGGVVSERLSVRPDERRHPPAGRVVEELAVPVQENPASAGQPVPTRIAGDA